METNAGASNSNIDKCVVSTWPSDDSDLFNRRLTTGLVWLGFVVIPSNGGFNKRLHLALPTNQMPSPKNAFSSPSSSSTSPSDSPISFFKTWTRSSGSKKRLTRQHKLRHVSDDKLGLGASDDRSRSLPVSPGSGSRSPINLSHWSTSAVPQPLPLPEFHSLLKQSDNLRSPREGPSKGEGFGTGEGNPSAGSYFSHQTFGKSTDHVATRSSKSPTYRRRGFPQDLNVDSVRHNFRLNVPARSAPASGFSSPALSPHRYSTADIFHFSCVAPQEFQVLSASEVSFLDRLPASSSQQARITPSPDHSPLHSPKLQSPCRNARSSNSVALHSHHTSLPESFMAWPEGNNANVHPLPLPPAVSRPSQSTSIRHIMDKSDVSPSIKGQWQKGKLIGRGTYGSVYEATNRETGALCAMKEVDLIPNDSKSAECIKQLEQEIKVLQNLKHPNIVQYYGSEIVEDHFCIYLEYVHPGSINTYVREHCEAVTESVVRNFTRHILSGLAYLHSSKIIHRDIKGANLLVDASGVVKLADFGLAKHLTGHATYLSLKGSPHWMAPEVLQAMLRKDNNPELAYAIDIWSLGCTVIEMLNGEPPWSEFNGVQAMFNVLNKSPPIPETLSLDGKNFLQLCLQRNPADRPSAAMLLEHPFVQNSHNQNVSVCVQEFSEMKLLDAPHSPRDCTKHNKDLISILPGIWIRHGKLPCNGESWPQSYTETSDSRATSCHSPRSPHSTLEVLPSMSLPELNCSSHYVSPSYVANNMIIGAGNNHPHAFLRTHGREIPHL